MKGIKIFLFVQVPKSTEMLLEATNISSISVLATIANVSSTIPRIRDVAGFNEIRLCEINSSLSVLRSRLSQAIDAAAMVSFGMGLEWVQDSLFGNSL